MASMKNNNSTLEATVKKMNSLNLNEYNIEQQGKSG